MELFEWTDPGKGVEPAGLRMEVPKNWSKMLK